MNFAPVAAFLLILPALFCSCSSNGKCEQKTEDPVSKQEVKPEPEVKPSEGKAEPQTSQPVPEAAKPAKKNNPVPEAVKPAKKDNPVPETPKESAVHAGKLVFPPCEHTVCTGDSLWKISCQYYGAGTRWKQIYEANKDKIKKADFLEPGTVLTIPAAK